MHPIVDVLLSQETENNYLHFQSAARKLHLKNFDVRFAGCLLLDTHSAMELKYYEIFPSWVREFALKNLDGSSAERIKNWLW